MGALTIMIRTMRSGAISFVLSVLAENFYVFVNKPRLVVLVFVLEHLCTVANLDCELVLFDFVWPDHFSGTAALTDPIIVVC